MGNCITRLKQGTFFNKDASATKKLKLPINKTVSTCANELEQDAIAKDYEIQMIQNDNELSKQDKDGTFECSADIHVKEFSTSKELNSNDGQVDEQNKDSSNNDDEASNLTAGEAEDSNINFSNKDLSWAAISEDFTLEIENEVDHKPKSKNFRKRKRQKSIKLDVENNDEDQHCPPAKEERKEKRKKKEKFMPPNYFISLRITSPEIHEGLCLVQETLLQKCPSLCPALVSLPTIHITFMVMRIGSEEEMVKACKALDKALTCIMELLSFPDEAGLENPETKRKDDIEGGRVDHENPETKRKDVNEGEGVDHENPETKRKDDIEEGGGFDHENPETIGDVKTAEIFSGDKQSCLKSMDSVSKSFLSSSPSFAVTGLGTFPQGVLFANIDYDGKKILKKISDVLRETFETHGIISSDSRDFQSHVTIMKLSKGNKLKFLSPLDTP